MSETIQFAPSVALRSAATSRYTASPRETFPSLSLKGVNDEKAVEHLQFSDAQARTYYAKLNAIKGLPTAVEHFDFSVLCAQVAYGLRLAGEERTRLFEATPATTLRTWVELGEYHRAQWYRLTD